MFISCGALYSAVAHWQKYADKNGALPHIIIDSEFEVSVFPKVKQYKCKGWEYRYRGWMYKIISTFTDEFVYIYEARNKNVAANLALLNIWLGKKYMKEEFLYPFFDKLIDAKYPKYKGYKDHMEKYMVLL